LGKPDAPRSLARCFTPRQILIVDDEPNILLSLQFLMRKAGYEVRTASDGEEALAEIARADANRLKQKVATG
jgi:CheY-like chemotaxis protein